MVDGGFKRGYDFPNEGFIQKAIEEYFKNHGYSILNEKYTDLVCVHPETGVKWSIEAKGETKAIGLDFRTCLGQLLQRMSTEEVCYGVAVPDMPAYRQQTDQVQAWARKALNLYWLFVSADGSIEVVAP
ncbi:hypothetical protein Cpap_3989 [Ruminiclostridium papyrosolvens DSM 2782]|uniref:Uncharacterized protein n=1 Tax=Ruminiclostridium papyrosolvens DSM 2782 TaxID=588581 RepID=F1T7V5_9FIRM|nr:hypothetical protein [Ruminiclostridium papyrosolvens]EGD49553.1 hypothetical protein Cpap_3989 [Ruminiclostridium papyrosolvens DSM 2782]WES33323.1 hypothetical protein P0092_16360 [Ruminiclostridium papyrosolvens DSM 2782]